MGKLKLIQQKLYWIAEKRIRSKHNASPISSNSFWNSFPDIIDCSKLKNSAAQIHGLIISEIEDQSNHVEAILYKQFEAKMDRKYSKQKKVFRKPKNAINTKPKPNYLNTDEKTTKKINFWLSRSKCGQTFNTTHSRSTFEALINSKIDVWSNPLSEMYNLDLNPDSVDELIIIEEHLSNAKKELRKLYSSITRMQSEYNQTTIRLQ